MEAHAGIKVAGLKVGVELKVEKRMELCLVIQLIEHLCGRFTACDGSGGNWLLLYSKWR